MYGRENEREVYLYIRQSQPHSSHSSIAVCFPGLLEYTLQSFIWKKEGSTKSEGPNEAQNQTNIIKLTNWAYPKYLKNEKQKGDLIPTHQKEEVEHPLLAKASVV